MMIDTTNLIKALKERKRQLSKWTDKDRAKERIDEIDCILDTDVPHLVKEESENPVPNDLEEAADEYEKRIIEETKCHHNALTYAQGYEDALLLIPDAFIAGAKWQAEQDEKDLSDKIAAAYQLGLADKEKQMMKEAVEGEIFDDYDKDTCEHHLTILSTVPSGYKDGDKVRIIIVKED